MFTFKPCCNECQCWIGRGEEKKSSALEDSVVELNAHAVVEVSKMLLLPASSQEPTYLLAILRMLSSISSSMPLPKPKSCFSFDQ
jgi:hypothetical protein